MPVYWLRAIVIHLDLLTDVVNASQAFVFPMHQKSPLHFVNITWFWMKKETN